MRSWTLPQARAWLFVTLFFSTFFLVRIYQASPVFFIPSPADDTGYLAYTESILRGERFNWCHPAVTDGILRGQCNASLKSQGKEYAYNMYTPGPAVSLLPVTVAGEWLNRLGLFRPARVDALVFWSIAGVFLLFALGTLFLFECTLHWLNDIPRAWWITILYALGNPVMYFVCRRPLMSHATEYFLFFAAVYFLLRVVLAERPAVPAFLLGLVAGLMMITRLNNIHFPAFFGILLLLWPGERWARRRVLKLGSFLAGTVPFLFLFLWINYLHKGTFVYKTENYYEAYTIGFFLKVYSANPLRALQWFLGPHWGLLWLVPFSGYIFLYFFQRRRALWLQLGRSTLLPVALIGLVFFVHFNMMANGPSSMSYGYRYVFSYYYFLQVAFLVAGGKFGLPGSEKTFSGFSRGVQALLLASALVSSAHILNYETRVPALRPNLLPARTEWIHHPYWRDTTIWTTPFFAFHSLAQIAKGNPALALAGSPALALPLLVSADTAVGRLPGIHTAVEYYRSENRRVYSLSDLKLTYEFEAAFALMALLGILFTRPLRRL